MKRTKNVRNLDSLERELYRLELDAKNIEGKLDHNLGHLQENFSSMAMNSLFCNKNNKEEDKESRFGSFLKNEKINTVVNKITEHIADRAADGIDKLIDKIFARKKHHSTE